MLKSMRKNMKAIMWVLLVTFVLWGGSSAMLSRSRSTNYAGTIFGKRVNWKEYGHNYSAAENQAKLMYGEKFNQLKQYLNLEEQTWDRLLLLHDAEKKHINSSDSEVVETICKIPLFQDSSGRFIPDIYKRVVEYFLKVPAREFEDQIKDTIKISRLRDKITNDVTIVDSELLEKYKAKFEKVNVDFALVPDEKSEERFNTIKENIASGWTFRKACDKSGLKVQTTGFFTKTGYIPKLGEARDFADAAFGAKPGSLAGKASVAQGTAIIFVLEKTGIDEEKFKKEKEEFRKTALEEKRSDYFEEYFKTLKRKSNVRIAGAPKQKLPADSQQAPVSVPMDDF